MFMGQQVPNSSDFYNTPPQNVSSNSFTDFEVLASSKYSLIVKARKNGRWFVLKALSDECRRRWQYETLLQKEYAIGFRFDHPNIARYIDFITLDGLGHCIQMEYVVGQSLDRYLASSPTLNEKKRIVHQLAAGLKAIHAEQIVHRDLKPANILITDNGHNVKIIDFGLSDADSYSILKEPADTRGFSSPEQETGGKPLDNRADIYSLGMVLKQLMLPSRYDNVTEKCCKTNREYRYNNVEEFAQAFDSCRTPMPIVAIVACCIAAVMLLVAVFVVRKSSRVCHVESNGAVTAGNGAKTGSTNKPITSSDEMAAKATPAERRWVSEPAATRQETSTAKAAPTALTPSAAVLSLNVLTGQLHEGIDSIMNPYIQQRKVGINIARHNTFMHKMERELDIFSASFFSRSDLGESCAVLLQERDRYLNLKLSEYGQAGKLRNLTSAERHEIIRRQMPRIRKLQDSLYGKRHQDTAVARAGKPRN